jgi:UDP-glucose 4-epimerase
MNLVNRLHNRAIVLGAAGFIGIPLVELLVKQGYEVICFDQNKSLHWPMSVKSIIGRFEQPPMELYDCLKDAAVYHLVSSTRPCQNTDAAPQELISDISVTLSYLEKTRHQNLRWVFASSGGTVYGPEVSCPISENAATDPTCSYGITKLAIEKYLSLYKKLHGSDYVITRLANPYGPGQDPLRGQGIIATLIYKALIGESAVIWGDGEVVRDYIYIDDLVEGLIKASSGASGQIYNIGSGVGISINTLIEKIQSTLNVKLRLDYQQSRAIDVRKNILNSAKIKADLGWEPQTDLADGIIRTANWIQSTYI